MQIKENNIHNFHINNILASDLDLVLNLDKKIELDKDFFRKLEKTKVHLSCF